MPCDKKSGSESSEASWLTTFGDMVTLLFTFFVLVYSFCSYNPGKWETAVGAIKGALSVVPGVMGNRIVPGGGSGPLSGHMGLVPLFEEVPITTETKVRAFGEKITRIEEMIKGIEGVEVERTETGFRFRFSRPILFERGSAELKSSALDLLTEISKSLEDIEAIVTVAGHTCDLPIHSDRFPSNWELSAARATNVLNVLKQHAGEDVKFVALARAEYSPLVPNTSEENRAKNRRVEIIIDLQGGFPFEE